MSDRLFQLDRTDLSPPPVPAPSPAPKEHIGDEGIFEVDRIVSKQLIKKRSKYLVKWTGWPESANSWVYGSNIDPGLVRAFEGKPAPRQRRPAPAQYKRGVGCARARLSVAAQKRGGVPQTISMVCGNVLVHFKEPVDPERMPTLKIIFHVLTMDKHGFINWPTSFDATTQAALRMQARALLKKMIDDPLNPVDKSMAPALTGTGGRVRAPAAKRQMVEVAQRA